MKKRLSAFNYFGGKNSPKLLEFVLANLSLSNCYHMVDVFGGSAAIVLNYKQAKIRTFNDLNSDIYNFFKVLRESPEALLTQLELTPHCREDYETIKLADITCPLEKARCFFIKTVCSFGNTGALKPYNSWSYTVNDDRYRVSQSVARLLSKIDGLKNVVEELRLIQIEKRDFRKILEMYDGPNTTFYVDPPYLKSTRSGNIKYKHEIDESEHIELCSLLNKLQGQYLLSGYDNQIYEENLNYKSVNRIGSCKTNAEKVSTEVLWANYNLHEYKLDLV